MNTEWAVYKKVLQYSYKRKTLLSSLVEPLKVEEELLCQHHSCQAHTPYALLSPSHRSSQAAPALLELCVES